MATADVIIRLLKRELDLKYETHKYMSKLWSEGSVTKDRMLKTRRAWLEVEQALIDYEGVINGNY